jgi:hypothetical protein
MVEIRKRVVSEVSKTTEMDNGEHLPPGSTLHRGPGAEEAGWRRSRRFGSLRPHPGESVRRQTDT